jgi:hypothetical protein
MTAFRFRAAVRYRRSRLAIALSRGGLSICWEASSWSSGRGGCEINHARSSYIDKVINETSRNNIAQSTRLEDKSRKHTVFVGSFALNSFGIYGSECTSERMRYTRRIISSIEGTSLAIRDGSAGLRYSYPNVTLLWSS